jgi:hypothetical protein
MRKRACRIAEVIALPANPTCTLLRADTFAVAGRFCDHIHEAIMTDNNTTKRVRLERRSPYYWRVIFDHPPLNIFGPESSLQLDAIVTAIETDNQVKVVVFDSAIDGFFITHYDFLANLEDSTSSRRYDGLAGAAGHVGAHQPGPRGVDCPDPRPRDWRGKRTCTGLRHALRQP